MEASRTWRWKTDALATPGKASIEGIPHEVRAARYPFRLLRYWFTHQLLLDEARLAGAPRDVAEVGIDSGQMLAFARCGLAATGEAAPWRRWVGMDCLPDPRLRERGYCDVLRIELEDRELMAAQAAEQHDVLVLQHVLEHLHDPLAALRDMVRWLRPGGLIVAGTPVTPEFAREMWQRRLRRRARPRGHVSVVSPTLVKQWSHDLGLKLEWMSGAFFMRRKGFALENHAWWLQANLAFGAAFPSWPGEVYWTWRKPT